MTSTTVVEGLQWMMLGPSVKSQISPEAHLHTEPLKHLYDWDLNAGQPHLIDWATVPDWYDLSVERVDTSGCPGHQYHPMPVRELHSL